MNFHVDLRRALAVMATALLATSIQANDTAVGDENGTITFKHQPAISMDSEALFISEELVTVDYVFTNTGPSDLTVQVAFPMPPVYFGSSDHTEIQGFEVWADGKPVRTERKWVVKLGETDISDQFRRSGWSLDDLFAFVHTGKTPKGKKPLPPAWFDDLNEPRFSISEYFVWQQKFPAGAPLSIRHSYVPSVTTGVPQPAATLLQSYGAETCMDKAAVAALRKRDGEGGLEWRHLSYILTTANNWQGAIKDFKLTIRKRLPTDVFSLCFDGNFKKTDPLTFEFRQSDFRPKRELQILFFRRLGTE